MKDSAGLPTLVAIGVVSAAFFSLTFVINSAIALDGGHWFWTAALRYLFILILLAALFIVTGGPKRLGEILRIFWRRKLFWMVAGSLACGVFYGGIAFAADHMPGWIVAATWQITIVASVFVMLFFSGRLYLSRLCIAMVVVFAVFLINWTPGQSVGNLNWPALTALLLSAIGYPLGNQLLNRAKHDARRDGTASGPVSLEGPFAGLFLLSLGSIPFWGGLYFIAEPTAPHQMQLISVFAVAVVSGIVATSLFYFARNLTQDPQKIMAVDITQASEVVFAMALEIAFVRPAIPTTLQALGVAIVFLGVGACCISFDRKGRRKDAT